MSRDSDVRVATLLGWTPRRTAGQNDCPWLMCPPGSSGPPETIPRFMTDWAAAGQVVEWMREQGWYIAMDWDHRGCSVWVSCESKFPAWVTGPEFPEALCRALLEAVETSDPLAFCEEPWYNVGV